MSAKPWAEPGLGVEERAALVAGHDAGLLFRRVAEALRAAEAAALEKAILQLSEWVDVCGYIEAPIDTLAAEIRALKADAPTA